MTVLSFLRCNKYPPSLDFLLITLGPGLLVLAALDRAHWTENHALVVFGRTPMFFYLVHLATLMVSIALWFGIVWLLRFPAPTFPLAYPLWVAYLVWLLLLPPLYLLCRRYYRWKFGGKIRWWTYYL